MSKAIGIDLGTTNSEVAIIEAGQPRVLPDEAGDLMLPSCVGFDGEGQLIVGREALRQYGAAPERTVRSIKRQMGTEQTTTFELPATEAGAAGEIKSYRPEEISAMILRSLKQRAEAALGEPVTQAVITVPAYFTDAQRQATKAAGEIAGLEVLQILNEPTAAALTYDLRSEDTERVLVYDLGGGTFDVSIVEITGDITEVLASKGNNRLGGDDFDQRLRLHLESIFQDAHGITVPDNALTQARLIQAAEAAKLELSEYSSATVRVPFLSKQGKKALHLDGEIERSQFERLIEPLLGETLSAIDSALEDADLTAEDLDRIILVGGSTRIPLVRKMVQAHLGQAPLDTVEPDLCVALGAALQAGVLTGEAVDSILVDVTPYSLGIAAAMSSPMGMMIPNFFSVIIPRNSVIPTSRSELYNTLVDFQTKVEVEIFQGENAIADENVPLGSFKIEGLPPKPAGEVQIEVHFDFDLNGILVVTAKEKSSGSQQSLTVNNAAVERLSSKALKQSQLEIDSLFAAASASAVKLDVDAEDSEEDDWDGEEE